jgi:hypothetical protein
MDFRRELNPEGLNWWTVVSGMGMNFAMTALLFLMFTVSPLQALGPTINSLAMAIGGFVIPLLTAFVCGRISDERYLAYAFYPLIGYLILTVPGVLYAGMFGVLLVVIGVLGAFNGATLVARRAMKRRQALRERLNLDDE